MENILDLIPADIFALELGIPEHDEYIRSGNCYEHYYELAKKYKPESILEIGTRYGYSLCSMVGGSMDTVKYVEDGMIIHIILTPLKLRKLI